MLTQDSLGSRLNGLIGARTQMSSIITSIVIVLSIFFLLPYLYFLPKVSCQCPVTGALADQTQAVLAAVITLVVYAST
jgi:MFS superfamily sulfate permease-like transporter